jgi:twinkle protein
MSKWAETGLPCPCGKSSDAYSIDHEGKGFCFRGDCRKVFRNNINYNDEVYEDDLEKYRAEFIPHRGISKKTFEKFGVKTKIEVETGNPIDVAFFYPNMSIKICKWDAKGKVDGKWRTQGDLGAAGVAFRNIFDKGSRRAITITEGEYDALSVYEMMGSDTAVVSVKSSATAKGDVEKDFEYINSFDKIIINMDGDEAGQAAAQRIIPLFDFKKIYNLKLEKFKDANDYLINGEIKGYSDAWKGVKRFTPDSIISTMSEFRKALREKREKKLCDYPFARLNEMLYGIHEGEIIVVKAEEGIGKTEFFRAIENKVLKSTQHPIGIIHLEEDNGTTLRGMAGYFSETPVLSPEMPVADEEVEKILETIIGENDTRFTLYSSFDVEDEDVFLNNVRFMVASCNAKVVFFDHISWLATGSVDKQEDERKKLDRIAQRLKLLGKELGFSLLMISHVNDDGKTRGSRYITKVANTVIYLSRKKEDPDPLERTKTYFNIEKARLIGAKEGPAGYGLYDEEKLMLTDPTDIQLGLPTE